MLDSKGDRLPSGDQSGRRHRVEAVEEVDGAPGQVGEHRMLGAHHLDLQAHLVDPRVRHNCRERRRICRYGGCNLVTDTGDEPCIIGETCCSQFCRHCRRRCRIDAVDPGEALVVQRRRGVLCVVGGDPALAQLGFVGARLGVRHLRIVVGRAHVPRRRCGRQRRRSRRRRVGAVGDDSCEPQLLERCCCRGCGDGAEEVAEVAACRHAQRELRYLGRDQTTLLERVEEHLEVAEIDVVGARSADPALLAVTIQVSCGGFLCIDRHHAIAVSHERERERERFG